MRGVLPSGDDEPIVLPPESGHASAKASAKASAAKVAEAEDVVDAEVELEPEVVAAALPGLDDDDVLNDDALVDDGALEGLHPDAGDDVVDVETNPGLVRRKAIALPDGEWITPEGPTPIDREIAEEADREVVLPSGRDALYNTFVREATRVARLSEEEERALGLRVRDHQDQAAAKTLVVHNLRLAIKMAHQYRRAWTNVMDLIQEASTGMAIASQRWDPDQGTRYGTYAVYWIRAQLTKFLMTNGRAIHTGNTRAGRKLYFQLPRVRRKLLAEGKEASVENIAAEVKEDPLEVARIVARLDGREASLDAQLVHDDDGGTLGDLVASELDDPEERTGQREVKTVIDGVVKRFAATLDNARDQAIWFEHLTAHEPKSLVELGDRFGVSKQRMGQLATRIKRSFRRHVIDELGPQTQLRWLFDSE